MAPEQQNGVEKRSGEPAAERVDVRRRRLGQAALGSVPVLLALRHRSVRASEVGQCMTVSAFSSLNVSNLNRPYTCTGRSPGAWMNRTDFWAGTGVDPGYYESDDGVVTTGQGATNDWENWLNGTRFRDIYGDPSGVFTNVAGASELSMMQVLWLQGDDDAQVGSYFVAAMLNHLKGWADPYDELTLVDVWSQYAATRTYSPPGTSDVWDREMIKAWLARSWGEVLPV